MGSRGEHIAKVLQVAGLAAVLFLTAAAGEAFGQAPTAPPQVAAPPASAVIPLSEVATRASEVANLLTSVSATSAPSPDIDKIRQSLPDISRQIDRDSTNTFAILGEQPPLETLQAQQTQWQRRHQQLSVELAQLTQRVTVLLAAIGRLAHLHDTWTQTLDAARAEQPTGAMLQQIQATLASIETAQAPLKAQEEAALGLQSEIAGALARCDEVLAQIAKAQKSAVEGTLSRENPPIWNPGLWGHARTALPNRLRDISHGFWLNIAEYLQDPSRGMPLHLALFAALAAAAYAARHKKRRWTASGIGVSAAVKVFDRPYSAALLVVMVFATSAVSPAPTRVKHILSALAIVSMIRLIRPAIDPR